MRFLSVGLALIGLLSPIVILCGCMLPITLCLGDISESKVQRYFFILRLLGNGVLFGWSIYGMSFVYTNPLIDTCLDPVRTVSDAASAATRCTRAGAGIASGRSGGRGAGRGQGWISPPWPGRNVCSLAEAPGAAVRARLRRPPNIAAALSAWIHTVGPSPCPQYTFVMMIINLVGWSLLCCCNCLVLVLDAM